MSSQTFLRCAASISLLAGATNSCMQRLETLSSSVKKVVDTHVSARFNQFDLSTVAFVQFDQAPPLGDTIF
jgi:hypothetical protein